MSFSTNPSFDIDVSATSRTFRAQVNRVAEQIAIVTDPIVKRTLQAHLNKSLADRMTLRLADAPRGFAPVPPIITRRAS